MSTTMEPIQLLTPAKVAELTGFSQSKVIRLIEMKRLAAINTSAGKLKPRYVVRRQDLDAFLTPESVVEAKKEPSPPESAPRKTRTRKRDRIDSHVEQYFG